MANGWNPVVLDVGVASKHKDWVAFNAGRIHGLPTRNPAAYERACWRRWLAFDVVGGGVMVDYDVMNVSLKPDDVILGPVLILDVHRVPCAVAADAHGATEIAHEVMTHKPKPRDDHWSDMLMFIDSKWPHIKICREVDHPDANAAKLLHYSTRACKQIGFQSKEQAIKNT